MTERVVYTALFGGYEQLRPQPRSSTSSVRFVCFTDEPDLSNPDWEVHPVQPLFRHDPVRSARDIKINGHPDISSAQETLWIDNRVELTSAPEDLLDDWLRDTDAAFVEHSFRDTLLDEFTAVADSGMDDTTRVWEHLLHLSESHPHLLDAKPLWTGLIARRRVPAVLSAERRWSALVNRYSRRDQLSILQALDDSGLPVARMALDNRSSGWHRWPPVDAALRRRPAYHDRWQDALRLPAASSAALRERNRRLERRVQDLEDRVGGAERLAERLAESEAEAFTSKKLAESARRELEQLRADSHGAAEQARSSAAASESRIEALEREVAARRRAAAAARSELEGVRKSRTYRAANALARLRPGRRS